MLLRHLHIILQLVVPLRDRVNVGLTGLLSEPGLFLLCLLDLPVDEFLVHLAERELHSEELRKTVLAAIDVDQVGARILQQIRRGLVNERTIA